MKNEFIKTANIIHGQIYDYSKVEFKGYDTPICIICPKHGIFWQRPDLHICGDGCPYCGNTNKLKSAANNLSKNAKLIHGDIYDYSKVQYINTETKVCIVCPKHGEFWKTPYEHINGQGCPYCIEEEKRKIKEGYFLKNAKLIYGDIYDYSKVQYINDTTKVCIVCPEHGEFWKEPNKHIGGSGCPYCNCKDSKISQKIERKLKKSNISFNKEQTFNWLKNKSNMFLDFYLPDYNVAIECHGVQHFKPVDFFGGVEGYNERKCRDILKYKLCSDHNIKIYYFTDIYSEYFDKLYYDENILIEDICKLKQEEG